MPLQFQQMIDERLLASGSFLVVAAACAPAIILSIHRVLVLAARALALASMPLTHEVPGPDDDVGARSGMLPSWMADFQSGS